MRCEFDGLVKSKKKNHAESVRFRVVISNCVYEGGLVEIGGESYGNRRDFMWLYST